MATIEERAENYSQKQYTDYGSWNDSASLEEGYIKGATEQKQIDDAQLEGIVSQWKQEEVLWIERYNAIRNTLIEHQGEYITLELISEIFGDDIPYMRGNNKTMEE